MGRTMRRIPKIGLKVRVIQIVDSAGDPSHLFEIGVVHSYSVGSGVCDTKEDPLINIIFTDMSCGEYWKEELSFLSSDHIDIKSHTVACVDEED